MIEPYIRVYQDLMAVSGLVYRRSEARLRYSVWDAGVSVLSPGQQPIGEVRDGQVVLWP